MKVRGISNCFYHWKLSVALTEAAELAAQNFSWFDFLKFRQSLDLELWQCKQVSTVHWKILFPKRQRLFFSPENTPAHQISFSKKVRPIFWILWFSLSISIYEADVSKWVMCHSMCDSDIGRKHFCFLWINMFIIM